MHHTLSSLCSKNLACLCSEYNVIISSYFKSLQCSRERWPGTYWDAVCPSQAHPAWYNRSIPNTKELWSSHTWGGRCLCLESSSIHASWLISALTWLLTLIFIIASTKLTMGLVNLLLPLTVSVGSSFAFDLQVHLPLTDLCNQWECSGSDHCDSVEESCSLNLHPNQRAANIAIHE